MLIALNKPYGVLCQFTDDRGRPTLADFVVQKDVYAAGRLDQDSEGLLLLTDDGRLAHRLTDPRHKQAKTYLAQLDGSIDQVALQALADARGVNLGKIAQPLRVAVAGGSVSPPIDQTLAALSRADVLARIDRALATIAA